MADATDTDRQTGTSPARDDQATGPSAEEVVRRLLQSEHEAHGPVTPRIPRPAPASAPAAPQQPPAQPARQGNTLRDRVKGAVLSYRPQPRHAALALLLLLVWAMPLLVPALVLGILVVLAISYLTLGHDRAVEIAAAAFDRLARYSPEQAETLRAGAQRAARRLSPWLDRLPERWTGGMSLPDFTRPDAKADNPAPDPFDRLAGKADNR